MRIGGTLKRIAYGAAGGGVGGLKGLAKGLADTPNVSAKTTEEFWDKVSTTNKSDQSTLTKAVKNTANFGVGMAKTAWFGAVNVIGHTTFGVATGWAVADAKASTGNATVISGKDMQFTSGNGVFTDISIERGRYGEAASTNIEVRATGQKTTQRKPQMQQIAQDTTTGAKVMGDSRGNGPLALMS